MANATDPCRMTAHALARAVRDGDLSAGEITEACLARVAQREPELEAWHCLQPERAREAARTVDSGDKRGLIAGVPVGVKDIVHTADLPTACGSPIYKGRATPADAASVAALRAEGGVVLGKTATTEFATYTPARTRNPHNGGHTPGGSSSGSAAAVADFQVPLAIGTQTGGSVIRPASFCGVVGYKPTFDTIDYAGVSNLSASLDTLGVFARDVADAALFVAAMSGWSGLANVTPTPPRRVRIVRAPEWDAATVETRTAVDRAAGIISDAGVSVEEADLPPDFEELVGLQARLQTYEGYRALRWEGRERADLLSDVLRESFEEAAAMSFDDHWADRMAQVAWQNRIAGQMEDGEIWLTASAPGEAPEGLASTGDPIFCRAWTLLHMPAVTLPNGFGPKGLPLGTQLLARRFEDARLLSAARWLEERLA